MSGAMTSDNTTSYISYEQLCIWLAARGIEPLPNYQLTDDKIFHDYALSFFIEKYQKVLLYSSVLWGLSVGKGLDDPIWYLIISFTDIPNWIKQMAEGIICPLSQDNLISPRLADDGHTYESSMIRYWLHSKGISPVSCQPLSYYLEVNTPLLSAFWRYFDPDELEYESFNDTWPNVLYKISQDAAFCQQEI